ncbi:MAG: CCA tRNA nucleotidyltransferase [Leptolyngbya sp. PLA1]|nr:CCA tRNA nucleotidyltransferase [Leptolyngbya sp. PLA1]
MALLAGESPARALAAEIVSCLRARGHVAYFAGGCVRDELLGLEPSDYDVATDATPDRVRELFPRSSEVGKCFGVVIVQGRGEVVEVATFRSDGAYSDSRRPDTVTFSTPQEDARRRDFTVNALFLDPFGDTASNPADLPRAPVSGCVIDLVGGVADLRAGVLRAVGDAAQRLAEDHLRALRAVRLASKLGFEIERQTAMAITRDAAALRGVSRERIGEELQRMMTHESRTVCAARLAALGLLVPVLGHERAAPARWDHLASLPPKAPYPASLAAWGLDLGLADGEAAWPAEWRRSLCLSNQDRDGLVMILRAVGQVRQAWDGLSVAGRKRLSAGQWFEWARVLVGVRDPARAARVGGDRDLLARTPSGLAPVPLLGGDDLVAAGWKPGPRFKEVLDRVYDAQLEEKVRTRAEALELAAGLGVKG